MKLALHQPHSPEWSRLLSLISSRLYSVFPLEEERHTLISPSLSRRHAYIPRICCLFVWHLWRTGDQTVCVFFIFFVVCVFLSFYSFYLLSRKHIVYIDEYSFYCLFVWSLISTCFLRAFFADFWLVSTSLFSAFCMSIIFLSAFIHFFLLFHLLMFVQPPLSTLLVIFYTVLTLVPFSFTFFYLYWFISFILSLFLSPHPLSVIDLVFYLDTFPLWLNSLLLPVGAHLSAHSPYFLALQLPSHLPLTLNCCPLLSESPPSSISSFSLSSFFPSFSSRLVLRACLFFSSLLASDFMFVKCWVF